MAQRLEHASLLENLNSAFKLELDDGTQMELRLVAVSDHKISGRQEMFSITFRCRDERVLPQRIYKLDNEMLGAVELFLVPNRKDDQGVYYEAVFNRFLKYA